MSVIGDSRLRVTVPAAASAIPALVEAIRATGNEVTEAVEQRPSFDDVFAALVRAGRDGRRSDGVATAPTAPAAEVDEAGGVPGVAPAAADGAVPGIPRDEAPPAPTSEPSDLHLDRRPAAAGTREDAA